MNFEQPSFVPENQSEEQSEKKSGSLKTKLQKLAAIAAIGAATLSGEGCGPDGKKPEASGKGKIGAENYDPALDHSRGMYKIDKLNSVQELSAYFSSLRNGASPTGEESQVRARDLAEKSGEKDVRGGDMFALFKGGVPVEISVSGKKIPISPDLYTEEEKQAIADHD